MSKKYILFIAIVLLGYSCKKKEKPPVKVITNPNNNQHVSVLTQHNDNTRAGLNNRETRLTTGNVNAAQFKRLFDLAVDDQVYAQPLVYGNLLMGGTEHNVVFIATVNNTVYAYDGDTGSLFWSKNYTQPGMRAPKNTDMTGACGGNYQDFSGNMGIVGTPVIDSASQTMYFVARSTDGANYAQYLHAINIVNGSEQSGSPVAITATYTGTGDGSVNNVITFDPQRQNQRAALTLVNGVVYVTFASHCDWGPYHGWILGYSAKSLQQQIVYNDTPNGSDGGIWESGMGTAADPQGNLYVVVGNGTVGSTTDPTSLTNRGESSLKLTPSGSTLTVDSYYTPYNYPTLENYDLDYGCMGAMLIPNSNYYLTGCKDANIYLVNKDNMGGYTAGSDQVQQIITLGTRSNNHCQPSYYKGASTEYVYVWPENDKLHAFPFDRSSNTFNIGNEILGTITGASGYCGSYLSVSSNGTTAGTGIVWATYAISGNANQSTCPGVLRAFDANDVTKELWNSTQNAGDAVGNFAKFSSPTIADGHVYCPTFSNKVVVYGIK